MTWIDPISDGGSPITAFEVICTSGGGIVVGPQTFPGTATSTGKDGFTGLLAGVPYTCTVAACNAVGQGPPSLPSNVIEVPLESDEIYVQPTIFVKFTAILGGYTQRTFSIQAQKMFKAAVIRAVALSPPPKITLVITAAPDTARRRALATPGVSVDTTVAFAPGQEQTATAFEQLLETDPTAVLPDMGAVTISGVSVAVGYGVAAKDYFGYSVSVSADGATAVVGAYGVLSGKGAAYVFTKKSGVWSRSTTLQDYSGAAYDYFGASVSVSADGATAVVGAWGVSYKTGAAYVFTKTSGTWSLRTLLGTGGAPSDEFGRSVSVSGDGTTAVVGSYGGAAYVFTKTSGTFERYSLSATLQATGGVSSDYFGISVSVSGDGTTAVVVAPPHGDPRLTSYTGAACVFTKTSGTWSLITTLVTNSTAGDDFGWSVSVSGDGTTAVVGANGVSSDRGAAYVFTKTSGTWGLSTTLLASGGAAYDQFGISVSVSADGTTAVVGAKRGSGNRGAAYVFTKTSGTWGPSTLLGTGGATSDQFGVSVSVSGAGTTAVVGADGFSNYAGAAYSFLFA